MVPRARREIIENRRQRLMTLLRSLPEATVEEGRQHLAFSVRGKKFAYWLDDHHGDSRVALNCKGERGVNAALADAEPDRFHIPRYLGPRGWIGLWLDLPEVEWQQVEQLILTAYRLTAPKKLSSILGQQPSIRTVQCRDPPQLRGITC